MFVLHLVCKCGFTLCALKIFIRLWYIFHSFFLSFFVRCEIGSSIVFSQEIYMQFFLLAVLGWDETPISGRHTGLKAFFFFLIILYSCGLPKFIELFVLQTIAIIPVLPFGVVQLGSTQSVSLLSFNYVSDFFFF